jgi:hypothetical protein
MVICFLFIEFPGGTHRLGATNPSKFHVSFYINDLTKTQTTFEVNKLFLEDIFFVSIGSGAPTSNELFLNLIQKS